MKVADGSTCIIRCWICKCHRRSFLMKSCHIFRLLKAFLISKAQNIAGIAKAASHKLPGNSSLNASCFCPVCPVCQWQWVAPFCLLTKIISTQPLPPVPQQWGRGRLFDASANFFYENKIWGLNKHQEKKRPNLAQKCIIGHFGPNIGIFVGWLVGGCGTRAVSRKTPIYFIFSSFWSIRSPLHFLLYIFGAFLSLVDESFLGSKGRTF